MENTSYDVFLSYNSEDGDAVKRIAVYLEDDAKLRPWLDLWSLIPGEPWVENLERGLATSSSCAVFVGKSGEGPWQHREVAAALNQQVQTRQFRVIPVLLPGAPQQPELPMFLAGNMWVDLRAGLDDDDALWRLECGIRGEPPGRGRPKPKGERNRSGHGWSSVCSEPRSNRLGGVTALHWVGFQVQKASIPDLAEWRFSPLQRRFVPDYEQPT